MDAAQYFADLLWNDNDYHLVMAPAVSIIIANISSGIQEDYVRRAVLTPQTAYDYLVQILIHYRKGEVFKMGALLLQQRHPQIFHANLTELCVRGCRAMQQFPMNQPTYVPNVGVINPTIMINPTLNVFGGPVTEHSESTATLSTLFGLNNECTPSTRNASTDSSFFRVMNHQVYVDLNPTEADLGVSRAVSPELDVVGIEELQDDVGSQGQKEKSRNLPIRVDTPAVESEVSTPPQKNVVDLEPQSPKDQMIADAASDSKIEDSQEDEDVIFLGFGPQKQEDRDRSGKDANPDLGIEDPQDEVIYIGSVPQRAKGENQPISVATLNDEIDVLEHLQGEEDKEVKEEQEENNVEKEKEDEIFVKLEAIKNGAAEPQEPKHDPSSLPPVAVMPIPSRYVRSRRARKISCPIQPKCVRVSKRTRKEADKPYTTSYRPSENWAGAYNLRVRNEKGFYEVKKEEPCDEGYEQMEHN